MPKCYIYNKMTESREKIFARLQKQCWFKESSQEVQDEILSLPDDYDQYLEDLASRSDEIGELDVLRLVKVAHGKYLITSVFEVRSNLTNQIFTYEFVSWKTGSNPGARGIVFLETNKQISHFLVLKSHKFSIDAKVYDSVGGLYLKFYNNHLTNLPKNIENEIKFHLGMSKIEFSKIIDLGKVYPDYGMTNNQSELFAATIDITHLPNLTTVDDFRHVHKPIGFELLIVPIGELTEYAQNKINDSYFLSALTRCILHPKIQIPL